MRLDQKLEKIKTHVLTDPRIVFVYVFVVSFVVVRITFVLHWLSVMRTCKALYAASGHMSFCEAFGRLNIGPEGS